MGRIYRHQARYSNSTDEIWEHLQPALAASLLTIKEVDEENRTVRAKKRFGDVTTGKVGLGYQPGHAKTFGEKVFVEVEEANGGTRVSIESKLVFGLFDWGENRKNCFRLAEAISASLAGELDPVD